MTPEQAQAILDSAPPEGAEGLRLLARRLLEARARRLREAATKQSEEQSDGQPT